VGGAAAKPFDQHGRYLGAGHGAGAAAAEVDGGSLGANAGLRLDGATHGVAGGFMRLAGRTSSGDDYAPRTGQLVLSRRSGVFAAVGTLSCRRLAAEPARGGAAAGTLRGRVRRGWYDHRATGKPGGDVAWLWRQ